jgi:5-methylcytosine-specific restriction endonuclease McrA
MGEGLRQKQPRMKLNKREYNVLRTQMLERDGWRCQSCGSARNLQAHHLVRRSQLGHDALENLITLCAECHRWVHAFPLRDG